MKNLGTKSLIVLLGILSLSLAALITFGTYYIKNKSIKTAETIQKIEESNSTSILVQSINSSNINSNNELSKLENLSLSQQELVTFIESLEKLAKDLGVAIKIVSVNSEPGKGGDNPDKIIFKIETTGSWSGNMQFLHAIEYLPYRTMINNSSLTTKEETGSFQGTTTQTQKRIWTLNTDLAVYSFK